MKGKPEVEIGGKVEPQKGAILVLALLMMFIGSVLALSLLLVTEGEMKNSGSYDDHQKALMAAEAGVNEVLWRLRLFNNPATAPPSGSQVTGKGLAGNNAYLTPDRKKISRVLGDLGLLRKGKGNEVNEDGDGSLDELDELEHWRDMEIKVLYNPGAVDFTNLFESPGEDANTTDTSRRGDVQLVPSTFSSTDLVPTTSQTIMGELLYTLTKDEYDGGLQASEDILTLRFLREKDFKESDGVTPMDFDGDGNTDELVFWDSDLADGKSADCHAIQGGGTSNTSATDDGKFNIDYDGCATTGPTGWPVVVIESTGRVKRNGKEVARRKLEVWVSYERVAVGGAAICFCGNGSFGGSSEYYSYDVTSNKCDDPPDELPSNGLCSTNGLANIYSNKTLIIDGSPPIWGSVIGYEKLEPGGKLNIGSAHSTTDFACGSITWQTPSDSKGRCFPNDSKLVKRPCPCPGVDGLPTLEQMFTLVESANDNANIKPKSGADYKVWQSGKCSPSLDCNAPATCSTTIADIKNPSFGTGYIYLPSGGSYYFEDFGIEDTARILSGTINATCKITGRPGSDYPINVYVKDSLHLTEKNGSAMVFSHLFPSEYIVWYKGTEDFAISPSTANEIAISLYAPNSTLNFNGTGNVYGFINTDTYSGSLNGSVDFYYDFAAKSATEAPNLPIVVRWSETL